VTPRVLFVSRERFRLPLDGAQRRKWDALAAVVDHRVLAAAPDGSPTADERFRLVGPAHPRVLDGALFYSLLPWRIARELRRFQPDAALVQGVHEAVAFLIARRLAGSRTKLTAREVRLFETNWPGIFAAICAAVCQRSLACGPPKRTPLRCEASAQPARDAGSLTRTRTKPKHNRTPWAPPQPAECPPSMRRAIPRPTSPGSLAAFSTSRGPDVMRHSGRA